MHLTKKKEITCPCQDAHAAQYLSESYAVAGQEESQFNLCLPLPSPWHRMVCVCHQQRICLTHPPLAACQPAM